MNREFEALIAADEACRGQAPTKADIKETIDLLGDFGIHATLPEFENKRQMYSWRKAEIKNKLARA